VPANQRAERDRRTRVELTVVFLVKDERGKLMMSQRVFLFASLAVMSVLIATAQTGSGRVQGSVKDASGAPIAGATITIANTATAVENTTKTNETGLFVFPPVVPGNYTITEQAQGMETWKGSFLLQVGQTA